MSGFKDAYVAVFTAVQEIKPLKLISTVVTHMDLVAATGINFAKFQALKC